MIDPTKSASDSHLSKTSPSSIIPPGTSSAQEPLQNNNSNVGITGAVVNTLWNGAAAVSNYVWSFWSTPPPSATPQNSLGGGSTSPMGESQQVSDLDHQSSGIISGSRGHNLVDGQNRDKAQSKLEKRPHWILLETEDYGIKLLGRMRTGEDALLTQSMINKIHAALPPRFRLSNNWRLVYSTAEFGFSLSTLFNECRFHDGPTLLVCKDEGDSIFGVFATEPWKPHFGHYGTGECFLWKRLEDGRLKKYPSTGRNSYFMISETTYLAAGCGEGHFGFWIDSELLNGLSQPVPTFDNDTLSTSERFKCVNIELWGLDMSSTD